jgi:hypothetical protein
MKDRNEYFLGRALAILAVFTMILSGEPARAEIKTFADEYSYRASKLDDRSSSRILARRQVRRLLLEALGAYLEKEGHGAGSPLRKDQLIILAAGVVGMETTGEKWVSRTFWLQAKITADTGEVLRAVDALGKDPEKSKELEEIRH